MRNFSLFTVELLNIIAMNGICFNKRVFRDFPQYFSSSNFCQLTATYRFKSNLFYVL